MNSVRFIDDLSRIAPLNMALDYYYSTKAINGDDRKIFRVYRWRRPTLSCGYSQSIETRVDLEKCRRYGIDIVRRPTGGRELLHENDLSFCLSCGIKSDSKFGGVFNNFELAASIIIGFLREAGLKPTIERTVAKGGESKNSPCLTSASRFEITVSGKKIVPMAQRIYPKSVLIHGSIPLVKPKISTALLLKSNDPVRLQKIIDKAATNLEAELNKKLPEETVIELLEKSLDHVFDQVIKDKVRDEERESALSEADKWEIK